MIGCFWYSCRIDEENENNKMDNIIILLLVETGGGAKSGSLAIRSQVGRSPVSY
jgi:hypothetical protein